MTWRGAACRLVVPGVTLALLVALTGCGKLGAQPGAGIVGSTGASSAPASAPSADGSAGGTGTGTGTGTGSGAGSAADSATLNGITQDLDSADAANTEAGSNAAAGDQAGATGDEP